MSSVILLGRIGAATLTLVGLAACGGRSLREECLAFDAEQFEQEKQNVLGADFREAIRTCQDAYTEMNEEPQAMLEDFIGCSKPYAYERFAECRVELNRYISLIFGDYGFNKVQNLVCHRLFSYSIDRVPLFVPFPGEEDTTCQMSVVVVDNMINGSEVCGIPTGNPPYNPRYPSEAISCVE